jgi:DNA-binding HxlR family transcriptional regulator
MTATMSHSLHQDCQKVSQILARIGEKWSMLVVMLSRDGSRRFNDIKRNTAGISQQMLTRTLRGLERDGIVTRTILPTSPPQVEYSLTELGHSMSEPVLAFGQWVRAISQNSRPPASGTTSVMDGFANGPKLCRRPSFVQVECGLCAAPPARFKGAMSSFHRRRVRTT